MKDDTISRRGVLRLLDAVPSEEFATKAMLINGVNALPPAQRWIPCSERLPLVGKVLAQTNDGTIHEVLYWGKNDYDQDAWSRIDGVMYWDTEIVAWMPMPQKWEGEQDSDVQRDT